MRRAIRLLMVVALCVGASQAWAQALKDGHVQTPSTWKLDVKASDFGTMPAWKSDEYTMLKDTDKWLSWTEVQVDQKGKVIKTSWSGKPDGTQRPIHGTKGDTASASSDGYSGFVKLADGSTMDEKFTLSADRKTVTEKVTMTDKAGKVTHMTWVYNRVK